MKSVIHKCVEENQENPKINIVSENIVNTEPKLNPSNKIIETPSYEQVTQPVRTSTKLVTTSKKPVTTSKNPIAQPYIDSLQRGGKRKSRRNLRKKTRKKFLRKIKTSTKRRKYFL